LNSSFQSYNAHSSLQKSQKPNFVLPSLGNKQHKVNKNIFERGLMFFFKKKFKDQGPCADPSSGVDQSQTYVDRLGRR